MAENDAPLDRNFWLAKIKKDPCAAAFEDAPEDLLTEAFCLTAVRLNGMALRFVPHAFKTEALCLAAVKQNSRAFLFVPKILFEKVAMADRRERGWRVAEKPLDSGFWLEKIKEDYQAFGDAPEELITPEFCLQAVKEDPGALRCVPQKLKARIEAAMKVKGATKP